MSASHEKSPTEKQTAPKLSSSTFWSVSGCQFVQLWPVGMFLHGPHGPGSKSKTSPCQVDQIPAVPTGLEAGTNPPGLPTRDQGWKNWKRQNRLPLQRYAGSSSDNEGTNVSAVSSLVEQEQQALPPFPLLEVLLEDPDVSVSMGRS